METNAVVVCDCCTLIAAPDVIVLEGLANGREVDGSTTTRINRCDGRSAWIFTMPNPSVASEGFSR